MSVRQNHVRSGWSFVLLIARRLHRQTGRGVQVQYDAGVADPSEGAAVLIHVRHDPLDALGARLLVTGIQAAQELLGKEDLQHLLDLSSAASGISLPVVQVLVSGSITM